MIIRTSIRNLAYATAFFGIFAMFTFTTGAGCPNAPQPECAVDADCQDDGNFCTGDEVCVNGDCQSEGDPCGANETCNEALDRCEECQTDADCDDGAFCNGDETCNTGTGQCVAGSSPCAVGETCDEATDDCVPPPPVGLTFNLTLDLDDFDGVATDDLFIAATEFNPPTASNIPTLQTGDNLDGGGGDDVLDATLTSTVAVTITPTINNINTINLTELGPATTTLDGTNISGVTTINSVNSLANVAVINLDALNNLGLFNTDFDLSATFISPAGNTGADTITLTLDGTRDTDPAGAQGASVFITTPGNGLETLNIESEGGVENVLEALTLVGGTTLTTLNVSGPAALSIRRNAPLPGTLTTINADATGGTDLSVGGALNVTYTGGSGNDIINFAGSYTSNDTIDGGGGTNTLGLNASQAVVAAIQSNVSNIHNIMIVNTLLGESVDVTEFGATDAILDTTGAALLLNLPSTITLGSGNRTITFNNDDINDALNTIISGVGTADIQTVNVNNADHTFGGTALTFTGAETVNYISGNGPDGTAADGNVNTAISIILAPTTGTGTLNIQGSVAVLITTNVTAGIIDASGAGAAFTMETTTAAVAAASANITGSPFNDELVGSNGNDAISGGDGNDQIKGLGGVDVVTGGPGNDHFFFDATNQFGDTLTDSTAGADDVGLGSGIINFGGIAGTEAAPVSLTAGNFETGRASISALAAGDALKIVRISGEQTTAQITTDAGAAIAAYVLVFDSTLQRGVLFHDADWSSAAGRTLVVRYENIATNAGVQALTFTDFEEID